MPNAGDLEKGRNAATSVRQSSASAHTLIAKLPIPHPNNNYDVEQALIALTHTVNLLIQAYNTQDSKQAVHVGNSDLIAEALERKAKGEVCTCLVPIIRNPILAGPKPANAFIQYICDRCGKENISHLEMEPE